MEGSRHSVFYLLRQLGSSCQHSFDHNCVSKVQSVIRLSSPSDGTLRSLEISSQLACQWQNSLCPLCVPSQDSHHAICTHPSPATPR